MMTVKNRVGQIWHLVLKCTPTALISLGTCALGHLSTPRSPFPSGGSRDPSWCSQKATRMINTVTIQKEELI